jgi:hypothetical protein
MITEYVNSSTVFFVLMLLLFLLLWNMQRRTEDAQGNPDTFDLRDIICAWDTDKKRQTVSTAKSFLAGTFLVSSYTLIEHYSDTALGIYLGAWVLNGGIVAFQKVFSSQTAPPESGILK